MRVIGLTGGIASGKSTVARMFADLGAVVLYADEVGERDSGQNADNNHDDQQFNKRKAFVLPVFSHSCDHGIPSL